MKKSSLITVALASLVGLVACNKGPSYSLGEAAVRKVAAYVFDKNEGDMKKGENPVVRTSKGYFDVETEGANEDGDYFLAYEELKDTWSFVFYIFYFDKTGEDEYTIVEDGQTTKLTLNQLNNAGNNLVIDMINGDESEDFPVDNGNWTLTAVYEPIEGEKGDLITSRFQLVNAGPDGDKEPTLVIEGIVFTVDFTRTDGGTTTYLFVELTVGNIEDYE